MMKELHAQGKTMEDVVEVLKRIPIHPRVVPAIKAAHALGCVYIYNIYTHIHLCFRFFVFVKQCNEMNSLNRCDLRVVSDANLFFIETILKHLGLSDYFSEINTNPSFVDEEGRLRIFPYHDFHKSPHGCTLCPPNMCKVNEMKLF
jgi:pyridoxal phosphate phosphatase PHOSPHO2